MPNATSVSELPNAKPFGPKADFPNATKMPEIKASREGTGNDWFGQKNKGTTDFEMSTSIPLPQGNTTERNRPKVNPPGWEK